MSYRGLTPAVRAMGSIHFEGNIIPHVWYQRLVLTGKDADQDEDGTHPRRSQRKSTTEGKPDLVAITILAEIVYWYRPAYVLDEHTGQVREVRRKFKADKLQRSYDGFAAKFGFSKTQVKRAFDRLEKHGLVTRDWRDITTRAMGRVSNVLFVEPVPDAVYALTCAALDQGADTPPDFEVTTPSLQSEPLSTSTSSPLDNNGTTYTESPLERWDGESHTQTPLVAARAAVIAPEQWEDEPVYHGPADDFDGNGLIEAGDADEPVGAGSQRSLFAEPLEQAA